jgi:hypothetical protein
MAQHADAPEKKKHRESKVAGLRGRDATGGGLACHCVLAGGGTMATWRAIWRSWHGASSPQCQLATTPHSCTCRGQAGMQTTVAVSGEVDA